MAITHSHARTLTSVERLALQSGWQIAPAEPDSITGPDAAALQTLDWQPVAALATVAAILRAADRWNFDHHKRFDAQDWWYRLNFTAPGSTLAQAVTLGFDGLATVAEAWLNGGPLFSSSNMFVAQAVYAALRAGDNQLLLRFKSLDALLQAKHPRPRWRAPMVEHQQLRWLRTTLLGRTPGWSPPAAAVGPWRPIWIESTAPLTLEEPQLWTRVQGQMGIVQATGKLVLRQGARVQSAALVMSRAARSWRVDLNTAADADSCSIDAQLHVDPVELWWPHTHGEPALYSARLEVQLWGATAPLILNLGRIGFRTLSVDLTAGNFALHVNGERIFCRGACWTPPDVVALDTPATAAAQALDQMVVAGMNMVRVGGTMVYENDAFLDACDDKGVLLWQDFMFANMDYPDQDPAFRASVTTEARQLLSRLAGRPCVAVLCGNSEGEQQAAMWGVPASAGHTRCSTTAARAVRGACAGHSLLALQRSRRRLPASGQQRDHLLLRRRRVPASRDRRTPGGHPFRQRMPGVCECSARNRCSRKWPAPAASRCTPRCGSRACPGISAPAGTSTTCAITTCVKCSTWIPWRCVTPSTTTTWI